MTEAHLVKRIIFFLNGSRNHSTQIGRSQALNNYRRSVNVLCVIRFLKRPQRRSKIGTVDG